MPNAGIEADLLLLRVRGERAFAEAGFDGAGHDRVAELLDAAEAHVETAGFLSYRPQLLEERARLHALRGDAAGATADLREACAGYEQVGARGHARRLRAEVEPD